MALIKSISGIRGTIGGQVGDNLTPIDVVKFTSAYAVYIGGNKAFKQRMKVVVGRDARLSGDMVSRLVTGTLMGCGVDVIDAGLCTTPGVEMAVVHYGADGGIILTASHNPRQWNALKLLDSHGEFLDAAAGAEILRLAEGMDSGVATGRGSASSFSAVGAVNSNSSDGLSSAACCIANEGYACIDNLGRVVETVDFTAQHIAAVLALPLVDVAAVMARRFKVVVDAVNSVGGVIIPALLQELGCEVVRLNCEPTGEFAHNPEPLPENLTEISAAVVAHGADLGVVVDPDVDRLAFVNQDGTMFGEEYTLVAVADYVLWAVAASGAKSLNTVSNLSSTRALRDVTESYGGQYFAAAVGEVNVVAKMKEVGAVIGGEGNGGVIYPELHYGRDALVGVALFLTHLAHKNLTMTELRATYPEYYISKNKIELTSSVDVDAVLAGVAKEFSGTSEGTFGEGGDIAESTKNASATCSGKHARVEKITDIDGVKIDFSDGWVHLRKSNTEPIIRIYSEARDRAAADALARDVMVMIEKLV